MGWSFMVDPFNLLNMRFVPCTLGIDEYGIIQVIQPRLDRADDFIDLFINATFDEPTSIQQQKYITQAEKPTTDDATALSDYAISLTLWENESQLDEAIAVSQQALELEENDRTHFNLGVIYRMRYDSAYRQESDFVNAVKHWTEALHHDPNNYIWRRRIQQYGPRLDKPYSFYDWVYEAREQIQARGAEPIALTIEPRGAEFAYPTDDFDPATEAINPDPDGRIYQDEHNLIDVDVIVVPPKVVAGESVRVHITMNPSEEAHWNNEVDDTVLWVNVPDNWSANPQHQTVRNGEGATSNETRRFEFELRSPENLDVGLSEVHCYSLYYICEDVNGICLYRRRDIRIPLEILAPDGRRLKDGG